MKYLCKFKNKKCPKICQHSKMHNFIDQECQFKEDQLVCMHLGIKLGKECCIPIPKNTKEKIQLLMKEIGYNQ